MKIAVLALQGAFYEQVKVIRELGAECLELRQPKDLSKTFDGLILPGGESTAQGKLLRELNMFEPLREMIRGGLPVLATCAGGKKQQRRPLLVSDPARHGEEKCLRQTAWQFSHGAKLWGYEGYPHDFHPGPLY